MKWLKRLICRYRGHVYCWASAPGRYCCSRCCKQAPHKDGTGLFAGTYVYPVNGKDTFVNRPSSQADLSLACLMAARDNLLAQGLPKTHDQN